MITNKHKYHMEINSTYLKIVRIKYECIDYIKCHIQYYSKITNVLLCEEKNVKLFKDKVKHWEIWNG